MIQALRWRSAGLGRPLLRIVPSASAVPETATRAASLSAIHRGLHRSDKAQFGDSPPSRGRDSRRPTGRRDGGLASRSQFRDSPPSGGRDSRRPTSRRDGGLTSRALDGAGSLRQQQKLKKKLDRKDEENAEDDSGRQTRRKRFLDPESSFGKQSLVYQLKHGALKEEAAGLNLQDPVRAKFPRSTGPRMSERRESRTPPWLQDSGRDRTSRSADRPAFDRRNTRGSSSSWAQDSGRDRPSRSADRPAFERRDSRGPSSSWPPKRESRSDGRSEGRPEFQPSRDRRETEPWSRAREPRSEDQLDEDSGEMGPAARGRRKIMMPMTIKYTTAASQFLYGKSVVKVALEQARRKLYNLYIYGGDNRIDFKDNTTMKRLAERHNVPITMVPNGEQRLMDKMSMGRPHNGFVLEASPLPQLPVAALGNVEESPGKLGFNVELDYQTKEEQSVNGQESFIPRSNTLTPKPFVLLLNEIMDPGNLGALLRTASYLGVDAVGITNRSSSTLTPVVLKSAAGAVEEITIFTVDSPVKFLEDSKKAGWKTYAAVAPPERKLIRKHGDKFISTETIEREMPLDYDPCILVMGNEGHGLSKPIKVAADYEVSVPRFVRQSCVDSLNVSVAAGLLCHAFVKEPLVVETPALPVKGVDEAKPNADDGDEGAAVEKKAAEEDLF